MPSPDTAAVAAALARWHARTRVPTLDDSKRPKIGRPSTTPKADRRYNLDGSRDYSAEAAMRRARRTPEEVADARARLHTDGLKRCSACSEVKPLDAFGANRSRPDGLQVRCRACRSATAKAASETLR
jgi:hypothetical protein